MTECHECHRMMNPFAVRGKCPKCKFWICDRCLIWKLQARYCPRCDVKM